MNQEIDILELFSGIGGFTKGFHQAGFIIKNHYYSEIDKHAIANYKHNFPNAQYVGSVTNVRNIIRIINQNRTNKLVITFGSPCQDFSLAGKGLGLSGNKSSLIKFALFLVKWLKPDVYIWENVKGAFSTNNGSDYWAIIQAFANLDGYRFEQQLINTAWFLPQNRERVYLIGHLTRRSKCGVFPIGESNRLYNESIADKKEILSNSLCLTANGNSNNTGSFIKSGTLRTHKDGRVFRETEGDNCPTIPARARQDGSGQVVIQMKEKSDFAVKVAHVSRTDEAKEIRRESMKNGKDYTPFQGKKLEFKESDVMNTITCATQKDNLIQTQRVIQLNPDTKSGGVQPYQHDRVYADYGVSPSLDLDSSRKSVLTNNNIRRLTEIECERLQGFPDDWTKYGNYYGSIKEIPKTQRYKLCGNAVTTKVVQAIAERLNLI